VALGLIISVLIGWHFYKRKNWKRKCLQAELNNTTIYQMAFDEEKISFITENWKSEILWSYYSFYSINKNNIYLIPFTNIYTATCIAESEIGHENFEKLKAVAEAKLVLF